MKGNKLTQKQELFTQYLFEGLSQRQAYIKAGYSSNQLPATLDRHAHTVANSDKIKARLAELNLASVTPKVLDKQARLEKLTEVALTSYEKQSVTAQQVINAIKEIAVQTGETNPSVTINMDKVYIDAKDTLRSLIEGNTEGDKDDVQ